MQLREVMTSQVDCATTSDTLSKVAGDMKRHNVGVMPVCENGKLVGIITDRDIVVQCVATGCTTGDCKVREHMSGGLVCGTPDMELQQAVEIMGKEQIHRLPVMENGKLVGMVSLGDIALHSKDDKLVADLLREISMPVRSFEMERAA